MNVLSLFDGMSCAMIALDRLGIKPDNYFASEVDKYAIQVSKVNWLQIIHIGDVTKVHYFEGVLYTEFGSYEVSFAGGMICGGSPCQGFSFAGKQLNFDDPRSKLFFEFFRLYEEIKSEHPDVKVFLENVVMKKEYQAVISEKLGMECIMVNSSLVSAQNRKRLYWTNIPFQGQPADRGILLKDVLETNIEKFEYLSSAANDRNNNNPRSRKITSLDVKAPCIQANQSKQSTDSIYIPLIEQIASETNREFDISFHENGNVRPGVALTATKSDQYKVGIVQKPRGFNRGGFHEEKSPSMTSNSWQENNKLLHGIIYRKLTVKECARLQGVPDHYCAVVSNTQAYKMLGNGWNVDTIVHLFEPLLWLDIL